MPEISPEKHAWDAFISMIKDTQNKLQPDEDIDIQFVLWDNTIVHSKDFLNIPGFMLLKGQDEKGEILLLVPSNSIRVIVRKVKVTQRTQKGIWSGSVSERNKQPRLVRILFGA